MQWMKEHPYLTGALAIAAVVLFFILRNSSSSTVTGTTSSTAPLDPNLLAAQTQVQEAQIAAGTNADNLAAHANDTQAALDAAKASDATQLQVAQLSAQVDTAKLQSDQTIAQINGNSAYAAIQAQAQAQAEAAQAAGSTSVSIAGIQGAVQLHAIDAAQATQAHIDDTSIAIKGLDVAQNVHINDVNTAATQTVALASIAEQSHVADLTAANTSAQIHQDAVTKNLTITSNADVQHDYLHTIGAVDIASINAQKDVAITTAAANAQTKNGVLTLLSQGKLGNPNRAAVATTLVGAPQTGVAIAQGAAATNSSMWSAFGKIGSSLFGGAGAFLP